MEYLNFFSLLIFILLLVKDAAPIQFIKRTLNIHNETNSENIVTLAITKLINCARCTGFWIGLIYYWDGNIMQSILMASLVSFAAEILYRVTYKWM